MALPATDNFTGVDGTQLTTYSGNWTLNSGDFDIQSNALAADGPAAECGAHWNADSFDADQYAEGTLVALADETIGMGVSARCDTGGAATFYGYYFEDTDLHWLFKLVLGVWTQLGSTGSGASVNDVVRIEVDGTTITPKINGSLDTDIGAQTDSAIASGAAGVSGFYDGTATRLDDWEGGNLAVGVVPVLMDYYRRRRVG